MLPPSFFDRDACTVARDLLGKVIRRKYNQQWLAARIIETEAYYLQDNGSHASLGFTKKRKALFMQAGSIYMYYAHGRDSLNISCRGEGNAVLIKSAFPYQDAQSPPVAHIPCKILIHIHPEKLDLLKNYATAKPYYVAH